MKTIAALILTLPLWASAQNLEIRSDTIVCGSSTEVFGALARNHQEAPVWYGTSEKSPMMYSLWINQDTNSWTLVRVDQATKTNPVCVLDIGTQFQFAPGIRLPAARVRP